jgi:ATP/maltotriose-dependent transcriptional regulator MalT
VKSCSLSFAAEGHNIETETSPAPAQSLVDPLTEREMEILSLIATGLKNKEIAATLFVSVNTVHYHTKNLYSKLGVNSRTQAITRAKSWICWRNGRFPHLIIVQQ